MFVPRVARTVFLLISAFFAVAAIGSPATLRDSSQAASSHTSADADWTELMTAMETMHGSMAAVHQSKDLDLNFVTLMLPHHQAAIEMAKAQLNYGTDPQMRRMAQEIITDQQSEIELMRLWLKNRRAPVSNRETR